MSRKTEGGERSGNKPYLNWLFRQGAVVRVAVVWVAMMVVLWSVFGLGILTHPEAWRGGVAQEVAGGWPLLGMALIHNLFILAMIAVGNLFVRFGRITPGLLILAFQAITIGWTAGTNAFANPFPSVAAANAAFLHIGLWETSAYALMCAVTLPKSLLVADRFPATEWVTQQSLRDLDFSVLEVALLTLSLLLVVGAAVVEAFF